MNACQYTYVCMHAGACAYVRTYAYAVSVYSCNILIYVIYGCKFWYTCK